MLPKFEKCLDCNNAYVCYCNDFESCPRIEMATAGFGVPYKPKDTSWTKNIPFGVYMSLKYMVKESKVNIGRSPLMSVVQEINIKEVKDNE